MFTDFILKILFWARDKDNADKFIFFTLKYAVGLC